MNGRALLAVIVLAATMGCAGPARPPGDWSYSEITAAIDAFRASDPAGAKLPKVVRSIFVTDADTLSVFVADFSGSRLSGVPGCELKLKRSASGKWAVTGLRFFGT